MHLKIKDSAEFKQLLSELSNDLVYANIHLKLFKDLNDAVSEYVVEFNQSAAFWRLTFSAHWDTCVTRLCRSYDPHPRSLNLRNLLDTINENPEWFDEDEFRARLKGNPFVDSLAASPRRPDPEQLKKDLAFVSESNPLVKTLVKWRHNAYAHRSPNHALNPSGLRTSDPLLTANLYTLASEGIRILNTYSSLFQASTDSTNLIGHDDYLSVLKAVREHLAAWEARFQADLALARAQE